MIISNTIKLSNTTIQYLSFENKTLAEASKPIKALMIMLHGFPENSWAWQLYLERLSDVYQVIAPDLPGYNASEGFSKTDEYNIPNLVETLAEFIKLMSKGRKVHLVAHDWGGVIAWPMVAFHQDLFAKLTILNAAHPTGFTREMSNNPKQQANSDYITDLVGEHAFAITSANEHKMLKRLYGGYFKKLKVKQQHAYIQQWSNQASMEQAFAYYKNMPQLVTQRLSANADVKLPNIKLPNILIKLPTQVLWGMKDTAFVPEVLEGMEEWVEDLRLYKFDNADHWLHHQEIDQVIHSLKDFHVEH